MFAELKRGLLMMLVMTVVTGIAYPVVITALNHAFFRDRANGSLITVDGQVIGSRLIGQSFTKPQYFHPRPSAAGANGYDPTASGGTNLGPTSAKLIDGIRAQLARYCTENALPCDISKTSVVAHVPIPSDAVTSSASGLDPDISPANADIQTARVAKVRGVPLEQVKTLVARYTKGRALGFLGEPRVNVLELNLALDAGLGRVRP